MTTKDFDLFEQFARIEWLLRRYNQQNRIARGPLSDPHRGQGRILTMLKLQPEISQKDLSFLLDIRPQSLGELLGKLERDGYITRTPSETDRRVMEIHLTEKGLKAADPKSDLDKILSCLDEDEQNNLSGYLTRLIESLEAQVDGENEHPTFEDEPHHHEHSHHSDTREAHSRHGRNFDPRSFKGGPEFDSFLDNIRSTLGIDFDPQVLGDNIRSAVDPSTLRDNIKDAFGTDFDPHDFMDQLWTNFEKDTSSPTEDNTTKENETPEDTKDTDTTSSSQNNEAEEK